MLRGACRRGRGEPLPVFALVAALVLGGPAVAGQAAGDFNGDKRDDLAIGVPFETLTTSGGFEASATGAVNVLYGTDSGLSAKGDQFWHQDNTGEAAENSETFGRGLAAGDFDNDGFDDLAIGAPGERFAGSTSLAGIVHVLHGSSTGLSAAGAQLWSQNSPGIPDTAEGLDFFGNVLVAGDFNGDGYDDLVISAPQEDSSSVIQNIGVVHVLYGTPAGLSAAGTQYWHQNSPGIADTAESGDLFGQALGAGDFNDDGYDDLAIGVLHEDINGFQDAGVVHVIHGSAAGLTSVGSQLWHQDSPDIKDVAEFADRFGAALAAGDFDKDGFDDLAVGAPGETIGGQFGAGAVHLLYGSRKGLKAKRNQLWHQNRTQNKVSVKEVAEEHDAFGQALAAGDLNADGFEDLAVGVFRESVGTKIQAGAVNVLYGTTVGLKTKGNQLWHQNRKGIGEKAAKEDFFGLALTVGRFNKGRARDLAIGVPRENVGKIKDAGAVNVIYGSGSGLSAAGNQVWHQDKPGVKNKAEATEFFGEALQ